MKETEEIISLRPVIPVARIDAMAPRRAYSCVGVLACAGGRARRSGRSDPVRRASRFTPPREELRAASLSREVVDSFADRIQLRRHPRAATSQLTMRASTPSFARGKSTAKAANTVMTIPNTAPSRSALSHHS